MRVRTLVRAAGVPLLIGAVVTASAPSWITIRIHRGDTLTAIARRHHTTVPYLVALNHLPGNGDLIYAGQLLKVPAPPRPHVRPATYVVRAGDTASGVALRHHTTLRWLAAHNRLAKHYTIYVGERLVVPGAAPAAPTSFAGRHYPPAVLAAAARHRAELAHRAAPSRAHVRRLIVRAAHRYGVDPALALAIGRQESGFQQRVVSPADAIGAMQVIPSTGDFVSRYLVHRRLDLLRGEDNVTAGVALLGALTRAAGVSKGVAGYYQGLGSVREHGMYVDTKAYVRNVLALREQYR